MSRFLAILIDPKGEEWFLAYGPKTKLRDKATRFATAHVANKAASAIVWGNPDAFWNSERQHAENTRREHKGWTWRIEEVPDSDQKREGWSVARYQAGSPERHYHAIGGGFTTDEGRAVLWPTREKALEIAQGTVRPEGWHVCVTDY